MWRKYPIVWVAIGAVSVAGCGGSAQTGQTAAPGDSDTRTAQDGGPAVAVAEFLEAVRSGDDEKTAMMLTKTAREKTAELNMVVAPPGSDTAKFEVGEVEYRGKDGARVSCTWSDLDENSQRRTDTLVWMVRREPEGWRIAGVAATMVEGEPPRAVNFEDPLQMAQLQRRSEQGNSQVDRSKEPEAPIRR